MDWSAVKNIGIDDTSRNKGHNYTNRIYSKLSYVSPNEFEAEIHN